MIFIWMFDQVYLIGGICICHCLCICICPMEGHVVRGLAPSRGRAFLQPAVDPRPPEQPHLPHHTRHHQASPGFTRHHLIRPGLPSSLTRPQQASSSPIRPQQASTGLNKPHQASTHSFKASPKTRAKTWQPLIWTSSRVEVKRKSCE